MRRMRTSLPFVHGLAVGGDEREAESRHDGVRALEQVQGPTDVGRGRHRASPSAFSVTAPAERHGGDPLRLRRFRWGRLRSPRENEYRHRCSNETRHHRPPVNTVLCQSYDAVAAVVGTVASAVILSQIPSIASLLHLRPLHFDDWLVAGCSGLIAGSLAVLLPWMARKQ